MDAKPTAPSVPRRRFTFGLRSLLWAVTGLAVILALIGPWTYRKVQQGIAIHHFSRLGVDLVINDGRPLLFDDVVRLEKLPEHNVTDEDLAWLQLVPTMEVVWLQGTNVTDAGLPYLRSLPKLRWLDLSRTRVTDAGLAEIRGFDLDWLVLDDTAITDEGLEHLAGLNVGVLSLERTAISDAGIPDLCKIMAPFGELRLAGTRITNDGIARLQRALPMVRIYRQ